MSAAARPPAAVAGVILAGGRGRRMGGVEKGLQPLAGRPLLSHVIARAGPQVAALAINANGDPARYRSFGLPVVADGIEGFAGPLAGVLAGLDWAAAAVPGCRWLASFACDAPFLPEDLVARLLAAAQEAGAEMACAASRGLDHPVFGLWPLAEREALRRAVVGEEIRKVDRWTGRYRLAKADFADQAGPDGPRDPFFNANRPEDLAEAQRALSCHGPGATLE